MKKCIVLLLIIMLAMTSVFANGAKEATGPVVEFATTVTEEGQIAYVKEVVSGLVDEYNAANGTNYTLKFSPAQGKDIINTRMSSNDRPDIFMLDSPADVQRYQKDGLLLDISATSQKYDWEGRMFDWAYKLSQVNNKVYSVPMGYEGIVLWYDKSVAAELGADVKNMDTLAEFESALDKAGKAGYIPIMLGSQDWPWAQEWYLSIMYSYTGRQLLKDTVEGKASWTDPRFTDTIELYKSWNDKGYLANGKSYILTSDDAINAFTSGKCLFKLEGTWATYWITPLTAEEQDNIGVILHPAINDTEKPHLPIAVGGMYCASATSADKADIIGYILNGFLDNKYQGDFLAEGLDVAPVAIDQAQFDNLSPTLNKMWTLVNGALAEGSYGYTTYAFFPEETRVYGYEGIVGVFEGTTSIADYQAKLQELNTKELANGFTPVLP